jgi:hypothetical protein
MHTLSAMTEQARQAVDNLVANLFDIDLDTLDEVARYRAIDDEQGTHVAISDRLAEMKRAILAADEAAGMDRAAIGRKYNLTRQRVGKILGPRENHRKGY